MKSNWIQQFLLYCFGIPGTPSDFLKVFRNSDNNNQLLEPDASKRCKRNILVLSSTVILAGLIGKSPQDIDFFGLQPTDKEGVRWFCLSVTLVHVYWYMKRYLSLLDDGERQEYQHFSGGTTLVSNAHRSRHLPCLPRRSDFISSLFALILTAWSWIFLWSWFV